MLDGAIYTIKEGDSMASISKKFYGTSRYWSFLALANGIEEISPATVNVGTQIFIPNNPHALDKYDETKKEIEEEAREMQKRGGVKWNENA